MHNDVLYHPGGRGRVLTLLDGAVLPQGFDLSGIAGVVIDRAQNPDIAARLQSLDEEAYQTINRLEGRFQGNGFLGTMPMGPRPGKDFTPPEWLEDEIRKLSAVFQNVTGASSGSVYFRTANANQFHIDGAHNFFENNKSWRMTFALAGAQTIWHNAVYNPEAKYAEGLNKGFPALPESQIGKKGRDFYDTTGALLFRTESPSGLFHKSPDVTADERRLVVTFDTRVKTGPCSKLCPNPCF
jgi:hypothetical protein